MFLMFLFINNSSNYQIRAFIRNNFYFNRLFAFSHQFRFFPRILTSKRHNAANVWHSFPHFEFETKFSSFKVDS